MKDLWKLILIVLACLFLFFVVILLLAYAPILIEELSYGESASGFCHKQGGTFYNNLFASNSCYVDGIKYDVYRADKNWRLGK